MYKTFTEFTQRIVKLSVGDCWEVKVQTDLATITCSSEKYVLPEFEIFVSRDLSFSVRICGWMLPEDHELYSMYG